MAILPAGPRAATAATLADAAPCGTTPPDDQQLPSNRAVRRTPCGFDDSDGEFEYEGPDATMGTPVVSRAADSRVSDRPIKKSRCDFDDSDCDSHFDPVWADDDRGCDYLPALAGDGDD